MMTRVFEALLIALKTNIRCILSGKDTRKCGQISRILAYKNYSSKTVVAGAL
jgi:hypothetical protein